MHAAGSAAAAAHTYNDEVLKDQEKLQLRFVLNESITDLSDKGTKLTRCYWDLSALLQGEWDVPIIGNMKDCPGSRLKEMMTSVA